MCRCDQACLLQASLGVRLQGGGQACPHPSKGHPGQASLAFLHNSEYTDNFVVSRLSTRTKYVQAAVYTEKLLHHLALAITRAMWVYFPLAVELMALQAILVLRLSAFALLN